MTHKNGLAAVGAPLLAFLASQHHTLHMLLLTLGIGGAGMSFMSHFPLLRRFMLLMSLVMAGVTAYQMLRPGRPARMRTLGAVSVALTLGMMGWSVLQFGF